MHASVRRSTASGLAGLGLCLGAAALQAATLEASGAWQQIYRVQVSDPTQPGYPGYPLLIDGSGVQETGTTGPLSAFLGDTALRVNAQARTGLGEHHVQATLLGRSRDLAPSLALPPAGSAPVPIYTPSMIGGWLQNATALSRTTDSFTAGATAQAQANLYADSALRIQLGLSDALSSWYGPGGPSYGDIRVYSLMDYRLVDVTDYDASLGSASRQEVGSLSVTSSLQMGNLKLIDTTVQNQFSDRFFTYEASFLRNDTVFRDGAVVSNTIDGYGFVSVMDDSGVSFAHARAGNHTAAFNVVAGRRYEIETSFYCSVTLGGITAFLQSTNGFCDGGQSAYWNGLSDITDANGQPLDALDVVSDSGFNYRYASAFSPAPVVPAPVPEPGTWAMLAAGLAVCVLRVQKVRRTDQGATACHRLPPRA